jgi:hypothetical protein
MASSGCSARVAYVYKRSLVKLVSQEELSASPFNNGDWDGCLQPAAAGCVSGQSTLTGSFRLINVHLKALTDSDGMRHAAVAGRRSERIPVIDKHHTDAAAGRPERRGEGRRRHLHGQRRRYAERASRRMRT